MVVFGFMITLKLNGLVFEGTHGVYEEEKNTPQRFRVDISLDLNTEKSAQSGDLSDTVDWVNIKKKVKEIMNGGNLFLAEKISDRIANFILLENKVQNVTVEVSKLDIWGGGDNGYPSAVISKSR